MKILIIGRGWIGRKLDKAFALRNTYVNLVSHTEAFTAIANTRPEVVINCAAVTGNPNTGECEKRKAETIEANTVFPILLGQQCARSFIRFCHFSSGCIYLGDRNYDECDKPNFGGMTYTASKMVSDEYLVSTCATVFRIRMPFDDSHDSKNLLAKLEHYSKTARLVDSVNSLSDADEMVNVAAEIVLRGAPYGPYNLVNSGSIATSEIARRMGLNAQWVGWKEFVSEHGERSSCTLSNRRANEVVPIRHVSDAIDTAISLYRKERKAA